MWYAYIKNNYVEIYLNKIKHIYSVKKCRSIYYKNGIFYFLNDSSIYAYKNNKLLFSVKTIEKYCEKIIVNKNIYISGNDSGTIYKYNLSGEISESIKIGEHISDFCLSDDNLFVLSYFNNKLTALKNLNIYKEIFFSKTPQNIIVNDYIYVLLNDGYFSYVYMYTKELFLVKKFKITRQIGNIYCFKDKIIFDGNDYRYIFSKNLSIISIKKSTGINLCKYSDFPMCENNQILDIYNNIIYPL